MIAWTGPTTEGKYRNLAAHPRRMRFYNWIAWALRRLERPFERIADKLRDVAGDYRYCTLCGEHEYNGRSCRQVLGAEAFEREMAKRKAKELP